MIFYVYLVLPLENLLTTAKRLGAKRFVNLFEQSDLLQELQSKGPFTLFAPSDQAFNVGKY